jgi:nickel-type superoxide dismutase maturation protease
MIEDSPYRHRRSLLSVAVLGVLVAGVVARRFLPRRVEVVGPSMIPALAPGDRLLVAPRRVFRVGDVVAARDPAVPDRMLVKRVHRVEPEGVVLLGDNEAVSRDSREFGVVPTEEVLGIAVYRYAPRGRSGRLERAGESPE